jgi:acetolactate synthase-1/3 small subunit
VSAGQSATHREFAVTTVGARSVSAVAHLLLQRGVPVTEMAAVRQADPLQDGFDIRLAAELSPTDAELLVKRLNRLIDVVKVARLEPAVCHRRRGVIVQVEAGETTRAGVLELASVFGADVLELTGASVTLELFASPERVDELLDLLAPFGIARLADAGTLALPRRRIRTTHQPNRS